jgi:O-succinylhomoserine sulfhydrylase
MSKDKPDNNSLKQDTLAVRAGGYRSAEGEHSESLILTSSFVFDNAATAEQRMALSQPGNVYSRYTNPTVRAFEERLALMEGAEAGVATSSGMAAILSTCMAFLQAGDHILCSRDVFGSTTVLLTKYIARFGVEVSFVPLTDLQAWQEGVRKNTRLLFLETPSNPLNEVADIQAIADIAHSAGARLVVDNCFCTPILQKPLELGADLSLHSATKYIDGQGRALGGAVVGRKEDVEEIHGFIRSSGPTMSPFNAWVFLKGLETLKVRMQAHSDNALALAKWLQEQDVVEQVFYAGLESHPGHDLAVRQQSGFSGVLSFTVKGGKDEAWKVIDSTELLSITANLGDAKSTIIHPATTTHGRLSPEQRAEAGIADNLIRVSVGLEDIEDIQADLSLGFNAIR